MAIRFQKLSDITTNHIVAVIYGQPTIGKTTLALSSQKPVLLDCDMGAHRALFSGEPSVVRVQKWSDLDGLSESDLEPFDTVVLDTVGTALKKLAQDIMRRDPAMGHAGALTLKGYGRLAAAFSDFLARMRSYSKDVILIAHMKEVEEGDQVKERIVAVGSSRDEVYQAADIMGRIVPVRDDDGRIQRELTFDLSSAAYAKNVGLGRYRLDNVNTDTMAGVIADAKKAMNGASEARRKRLKLEQKLAKKVAKCENPAELNALIAKMADAPKVDKQVIVRAGLARGWEWDRGGKVFVEREPGEEG